MNISTDEARARARAAFASLKDASPSFSPSVARAKWPKWAQLLAELAIPEDAGVGDIIHRHAGAAGETYIELRKAIKWPCKCAQRRARLNQRFPLP